jgi:gliding motility-associated-like protein
VNFTNTTPGNIASCEWNFGNNDLSNDCGTVSTTYQNDGYFDVTLTTTSVNGCVNSATYDDYIYVENDPLAGFNPSLQTLLSLDTDVSFNNTTIGAVNYIWNFGDGSAISNQENPVHTFPQDQTSNYLVTLYAYSPIGCADSISSVIKVTEEVIYYIPNTFTPDNDEFNQHFQPVFTAGYDPYDFNMLIFNRWGEIIFESNDASVGWDGTYGGDKVLDGTYAWKIEFKTLASDERVMISGHVNIIR